MNNRPKQFITYLLVPAPLSAVGQVTAEDHCGNDPSIAPFDRNATAKFGKSYSWYQIGTRDVSWKAKPAIKMTGCWVTVVQNLAFEA